MQITSQDHKHQRTTLNEGSSLALFLSQRHSYLRMLRVMTMSGIYTDAHVEGWKKVADAVHKQGSFISLQLWALGRAAETAILAKENISPYVSPSPARLPGRLETEVHFHVHPCRKNSIRAAFDGVEIHGANGCLIDQFIQDVTNHHMDECGGSIENRARFALEVVDAVVEAVGAERTGFRMSPWGTFILHKHKLAYIHVVEPHACQHNSDFIRDIWNGREGCTLIAQTGITGRARSRQ
ncbi:hypothetical protein DFH29DRAFT_214837 [Suillus ampliporus]|nr:hypothetical protein DFH29DRAFT_214837 [Suillus ampliporus]